MQPPTADLIPVSLEPSPVIDAYKPGVDRTLIVENLKLTAAQRVAKMLGALRFFHELQAAGKKAAPR
jgi:hypothetical protein